MDSLRYFNLNESYPYVNGVHYNNALNIFDISEYSGCVIEISSTNKTGRQPYACCCNQLIYPSFSGYYTSNTQGQSNCCSFFL